MHIAGRIKVGMALVVARGTIEELASFAGDPLPRHQAEPHPFGSTTGTILRCAMGIDFDAHYPFCIRFFLRELVNFAFELIGLIVRKRSKSSTHPGYRSQTSTMARAVL